MLTNCIKSASIVGLIFIVIAGCTSTNDLVSPSESNVLIPLAVGNYWHHEVENYRNDILISRGSDTVEVVSHINWGGNRWYGYRGGVGLCQDMFLRNEEDGVWHLLFDDDRPLDAIMEPYFKYPASIDDSWVAGFTLTVVSTSDTVTVPAGIFEGCYHYRLDCPAEAYFEDFSLWIKPGVGEVQRNGAFFENGVQVRDVWKLKRYNLE